MNMTRDPAGIVAEQPQEKSLLGSNTASSSIIMGEVEIIGFAFSIGFAFTIGFGLMIGFALTIGDSIGLVTDIVISFR